MTQGLPTFDLSDLYAGIKDPKIYHDLQHLEQLNLQFDQKYRNKVTTLSAKELFEAIKSYETLSELAGRLQSYAYLMYATHTQDGPVLQFYQSIEEKISDFSRYTLFFTLDLNRVKSSVLKEGIQGPLKPYATWITEIRRFKKHELDEHSEMILHDFSIPAYQSWVRLYDETLGGLQIHVAGKEISLADALHNLSDKDRQLRQKTAKGIEQTLRKNRNIFCLIYNTLIKTKGLDDRWHRFAQPADARHLSNQVDGKVVDTLVETVWEMMPQMSHRYYALKAEILGQSTLEYWDRNAPLFEEKESDNYTWKEAKELVLSAYHAFSPQMAELGKPFFEKGWIDAPPTPGKESGAFSHPTVPSVHPYILMNFYGKGRDVMTLAHELGHGVHQTLAAHQGYFQSDTPLTIAETASVFGEMLTFQQLLRKASNRTEKLRLLSSKIEDMLNTVVRQIAFFTFESQAHKQRAAAGELSESDIAAIWIDTQKRALGSAFSLDQKHYGDYWMYISHFYHTPFYVYAYAFGDCLVNALYGLYEQGHPDFQNKYLEFLKAGGSKSYVELLAPFGLNPKTKSFWKLGLSRIVRLIDEFEKLLKDN